MFSLLYTGEKMQVSSDGSTNYQLAALWNVVNDDLVCKESYEPRDLFLRNARVFSLQL